MLRFMGLQGVGHDWATQLNWTCKLFGLRITVEDQDKIEEREICKGEKNIQGRAILGISVVLSRSFQGTGYFMCSTHLRN